MLDSASNSLAIWLTLLRLQHSCTVSNTALHVEPIPLPDPWHFAYSHISHSTSHFILNQYCKFGCGCLHYTMLIMILCSLISEYGESGKSIILDGSGPKPCHLNKSTVTSSMAEPVLNAPMLSTTTQSKPRPKPCHLNTSGSASSVPET